MRDVVKQMVDAALKLGNGQMPILIKFGQVDLVDAATYLRGKHGCKAIVLSSKDDQVSPPAAEARSE
jgi:hypothetical protein